MNKTADAVIIGGGISGMSIAYNLAKRGVKNIVVVELGYPACGSTGRCGAGVRMQWGTEMNCKFAKYSIDFFEHADQELGYGGSIDFKQSGYLIASATEKENTQFIKNIELQNKLGIPSKLLTPAEAKEIIPYLDETKIISAAFCPKDGHLNPFHATQAYADAAVRLGASIEKFTVVTGIDVKSGRINTVHTNKGSISTPIVVNAAGGNAGVIASMVNIDIPIFTERHQILVTEPVAPLQEPMFMSFSMNIYCQQTPEGSFIMGRSDENEKEGFNIKSDWRFMEQMARTCGTLLPLLKKLSIVRQWAGLYTITPDRQPIYGPVKEVEGFYLACGFSGHGFMFAPATGTVIAESILKLPETLPISMLDKDRFMRGEQVFEPSVV